MASSFILFKLYLISNTADFEPAYTVSEVGMMVGLSPESSKLIIFLIFFEIFVQKLDIYEKNS